MRNLRKNRRNDDDDDGNADMRYERGKLKGRETRMPVDAKNPQLIRSSSTVQHYFGCRRYSPRPRHPYPGRVASRSKMTLAIWTSRRPTLRVGSIDEARRTELRKRMNGSISYQMTKSSSPSARVTRTR